MARYVLFLKSRWRLSHPSAHSSIHRSLFLTPNHKQAAEKAYAKIALAYDRFRKAGDLYEG